MNTQDIEMVRWWQRNDRVTLSIASDPAGLGRMSWATRHFGLPWQRVWGLGWEECNADLSEFTPHWTYRIDPAWEPPVEPVKNADEKKPDMLVCPDSEGDKSALCGYCPHRKEHGRCGITCRETFCTTKQKRIACVPVKLPGPLRLCSGGADTGREVMEKFCYWIGCSGLSGDCPGDPNCSILRKIFQCRGK